MDNLQSFEQDMIARGKALAQQGKVALVQLAQAAETSTIDAARANLPKLEQAALALTTDVIPSGQFREYVKAVLGYSEQQLEQRNPQFVSELKGVLDTAVARLQGIIGA